MAVVPIVTGEDAAVLRAKTHEVDLDKEVKALIVDLIDTCIDAQGAGLAAPQIGISKRVCVARVGGALVPLINPNIVWFSDTTDLVEEGCLSLPDVWIHVPRSTGIILKYLDEKGVEQERKLSAMDARVVQHEVDHLVGKLIVDY